MFGNTDLESIWGEVYADLSQDEAGLHKLFLQFSLPGGTPSHALPECPSSIHEGGELGYALSHSFGVVFDNPELIVACVAGSDPAPMYEAMALTPCRRQLKCQLVSRQIGLSVGVRALRSLGSERMR